MTTPTEHPTFYCVRCPKTEFHLHDESELTDVVVSDVHSTIALVHARRQYVPASPADATEADWLKWHEATHTDVPHQGVAVMLDLVSEAAQVLVVSYGVTAPHLPKLVQWLHDSEITFDAVLVHPEVPDRRPVDQRSDEVAFKLAAVDLVNKAGLSVVLFVDDRDYVCEAMEENDVTALCVNPRYQPSVPVSQRSEAVVLSVNG
jgi:hypothetical protein